jgi:hypothetical protein
VHEVAKSAGSFLCADHHSKYLHKGLVDPSDFNGVEIFTPRPLIAYVSDPDQLLASRKNRFFLVVVPRIQAAWARSQGERSIHNKMDSLLLKVSNSQSSSSNRPTLSLFSHGQPAL